MPELSSVCNPGLSSCKRNTFCSKEVIGILPPLFYTSSLEQEGLRLEAAELLHSL